jgi:hypothetical protein
LPLEAMNMPVLLESMKYFQPSRTINYRNNETPFLLNLYVLVCYLYIMVNKIYRRTIAVCAELCMAIMDLLLILGQAPRKTPNSMPCQTGSP